jgi:hypothetical protein
LFIRHENTYKIEINPPKKKEEKNYLSVNLYFPLDYIKGRSEAMKFETGNISQKSESSSN